LFDLGGFHASHPALIPAGAALSHLDPEVSSSETYSQVREDLKPAFYRY
jgi:hypothetical protein